MGAGAGLTVVLYDIDNFKRINDTHGHADGDQVIRDFAGLLKAMTREGVDSVIRYGGEECLAILPSPPPARPAPTAAASFAPPPASASPRPPRQMAARGRRSKT